MTRNINGTYVDDKEILKRFHSAEGVPLEASYRVSGILSGIIDEIADIVSEDEAGTLDIRKHRNPIIEDGDFLTIGRNIVRSQIGQAIDSHKEEPWPILEPWEPKRLGE